MNFVKCPISYSLVDKISTNSQTIVSLTYCTLYSLNHSDSALSSPLRSQTPRCPAMTLDSPIACSRRSLTLRWAWHKLFSLELEYLYEIDTNYKTVSVCFSGGQGGVLTSKHVENLGTHTLPLKLFLLYTTEITGWSCYGFISIISNSNNKKFKFFVI